MSVFGSLWRGIAYRAAPSVVIFVVALVAAAAATVGPTYYTASKTSIVQDTIATAPTLGRGFEVVQSGGVAGLIGPLAAQVDTSLANDLGSRVTAQRLFAPPIDAVESTAFLAANNELIPLVWRSDVCDHLAIRGACPTSAHQVVIAVSLARTNHWRVGRSVRFPSWGALVVTGIYTPPGVADDYWFGRSSSYFGFEIPKSFDINAPPQYDAMFTPRATVEGVGSDIQGSAVIDDLLAVPRVHESDVARLTTAVDALVNDPQLSNQQAVVTSDIAGTLGTVRAGWQSLEVPVVVVTVQLLVLIWLLLFVAVTNTVEARGPDIALAKLRGEGRWRTVSFGLSEPVTLILAALPGGAVVGWAVTGALSAQLLRPGTPVTLPALGWAAAGVASLGGLAAVVLAARRTLVRPVVEQWQRAGRRITDRAWVLDSVLLAGAAAGLVELAVTGQVTSAHGRVLSLLVPGLLGLAVAVVASRLLPVTCRAAIGRTRRLRSLAVFLTLRQVARRPGGVRTTILLTTSFALATFAVAAWDVGHNNDRLVADAMVGAPTVLTVSTPGGTNLDALGALVARADPSGRRAVAVEYAGGQPQTIAVDPARFGHVASWNGDLGPNPSRALTAAIDPPEPRPVIVDGDALRLTVTVSSLSPPGDDLIANVVYPGGEAPTPVDLGNLPAAGTTRTLSASLPGGPCTLQDLTLNLESKGPETALPITGTITFSALEAHRPRGWVSVNAEFAHSTHWRPATVDHPPETLKGSPTGLRWTFATTEASNPSVVSVNRPSPLPAVVPSALNGRRLGPFEGNGLDGRGVAMRAVAVVAAVPGAPANGVVVDRDYAELEASGNLATAITQVWLGPGAEPVVVPRLEAAGVKILETQRAGATAALFGRQGPGLASVLFLADAVAAAILAAAGASLGLYLNSRRRRYEYAALVASGLSRSTLLRSLIGEQLLVVGFGTVVGVATGLAAVALALRSVPEFLSLPAAPQLSYAPQVAPLVAVLGLLVAGLVVAAVAASTSLARTVRLDQLREAPA